MIPFGSIIEGHHGFTGPQGTAVVFKGIVPYIENLPATTNEINDMYQLYDGKRYVWSGKAWVSESLLLETHIQWLTTH